MQKRRLAWVQCATSLQESGRLYSVRQLGQVIASNRPFVGFPRPSIARRSWEFARLGASGDAGCRAAKSSLHATVYGAVRILAACDARPQLWQTARCEIIGRDGEVVQRPPAVRQHIAILPERLDPSLARPGHKEPLVLVAQL